MSAAPEPAFQLEGVAFHYDGVTVLEDVDLRVEPGEFVAVVGPNGGGKTTLLKLLLGLLEPTAGRIRVFGLAPWRARQHVGYMPQHVLIDNSFPITAEEVVMLGRLTRDHGLGRFSRADREASEQALLRVGCAHLRHSSFATLSGGQRQLVLIARALVSQPRLLLLDQPTANLDPAVQDSFYQLLQELEGILTVVLVSHDVGFVSKETRKVLCVNRALLTHPSTAVCGDIVAAMTGQEEARMVDHAHEVRDHDQREGEWSS